MKVRRKRFVSVVVLLTAAVLSVALFVYYYFYPNYFETDGNFSATDIAVNGAFDNSLTFTSSFLFTTFHTDDAFNVTMIGTAGWKATRLTVYNASIHPYPIVESDVLYETNGSVSFSIVEPRFFHMTPVNFSVSVLTGEADGILFTGERSESLLMDNVTYAGAPFYEGSFVVFFHVLGGNISIPEVPSFNLNNATDVIGMRLEMQVFVRADVVSTGKFRLETDNFFSVRIESWSSLLNPYFNAPEGFLRYASTVQQLSSAKNISITEFAGAIALLNPQSRHEVSMQGYAAKILIDGVDVTGPDPIRDLIHAFNPYTILMLVLVSTYVVMLALVYKREQTP
jgi:hypothetical protein